MTTRERLSAEYQANRDRLENLDELPSFLYDDDDIRFILKLAGKGLEADILRHQRDVAEGELRRRGIRAKSLDSEENQ